MAARRALVVASYQYADAGLRRLTAPAHDAEALASVLEDREIAGFDVTTLVNEPHHVVGEAIADFYGKARRDDLTLLYFTGHGVKDDEGRLYLAMANTRRDALMFTAISAAQLNDAMESSPSRRKVLVLDCCYSGAFPAGRTAKADEGVQTLERFQGRGRAVLTASDATQYAFEGDDVRGSGTASVFTRYLVEALRTGAADLDEDGDIALDELYSYVRDRVVSESPQQRPKKQEDVDGRLLIARNVHWQLPAYLEHAIESPIAAQRLSAVQELEHLHRSGNDVVRVAVARQITALTMDDSRAVSAAATEAAGRLGAGPSPSDGRGPSAPAPVEDPPPSQARAEAVPERASAREPDRAAPPVTPVASPVEKVPRGGAAPQPAVGAPPVSAPTAPLVGLVLGLVATAAALLVVSRFEAFESTNGYHADDMGWYTANWFVQGLLPLVAAVALVSAGRRSAAAFAVGSGVVAGVVLNLVCQLVMSAIVTLDPDVGYGLGPAWWSILLAGVALAVVVALALRTAPLRGRVGVRRDARAVVAAALVALSTVGWLVGDPISTDFGWWLYLRVAGVLFSAFCLAVAVLDLGPSLRLFGLAAVTTTGTWFVAAALETLALQPSGYQPAALVVVIAVTLLGLGGAYLGQLRRPVRATAASSSG